jgi:hypothetical protein
VSAPNQSRTKIATGPAIRVALNAPNSQPDPMMEPTPAKSRPTGPRWRFSPLVASSQVDTYPPEVALTRCCVSPVLPAGYASGRACDDAAADRSGGAAPPRPRGPWSLPRAGATRATVPATAAATRASAGPRRATTTQLGLMWSGSRSARPLRARVSRTSTREISGTVISCSPWPNPCKERGLPNAGRWVSVDRATVASPRA